jgi:hypothetical protein
MEKERKGKKALIKLAMFNEKADEIAISGPLNSHHRTGLFIQ